ncbi:MAG: TetR/AcrR family transcriptional regulator [Deltaproteobacteria bacterium]|nr:TetR/AcrR family transcriptional regulator [Deltaproteobacteria bacterium]
MSNTKTKILDLAESLTQERGFNGFSYLDLAAEIGVKHASIHYHFKSKADLALALVERLREQHSSAFEAFDHGLETPQQRLQAVIEFFQRYAQEKKFCMCGMMSAELQSVSPEVRRQLIGYFKDFQHWITKQFIAMKKEDAQNRALSFVSALEGSLLLARLEDDPAIIASGLHSFVSD